MKKTLKCILMALNAFWAENYFFKHGFVIFNQFLVKNWNHYFIRPVCLFLKNKAIKCFLHYFFLYFFFHFFIFFLTTFFVEKSGGWGDWNTRALFWSDRSPFDVENIAIINFLVIPCRKDASMWSFTSCCKYFCCSIFKGKAITDVFCFISSFVHAYLNHHLFPSWKALHLLHQHNAIT